MTKSRGSSIFMTSEICFVIWLNTLHVREVVSKYDFEYNQGPKPSNCE